MEDKWRAADVIVKGAGTLLVTGAVAWYGYYSQDQNARRAVEGRRAQVFVQALTSREAANASMKADMFNTMMAHYFGQRNDPATQLVFVKLIALNFEEYLHLKPLFESLDQELTEYPDLRADLRSTARRIKRDQIDRITARDGIECELELRVGEVPQPAPCLSALSLELSEMHEDYITIKSYRQPAQPDPDIIQASSQVGPIPPIFRDTSEFRVGYYDMALLDYSTMTLGKSPLKFSVVLNEIDREKQSSKVDLVIFPGGDPRDSFWVDDRLMELSGPD